MKYKLPINYSELTWQEKKEVRQQYITEQNNKCLFCKENIFESVPDRILKKKIDWSFFPDNFLKYPIHLQHNHKTDKTEGAVHAYCNAVMWQYHNK